MTLFGFPNIFGIRNAFSALNDAVGWMVEGHPTCKKLSGEVLVRVSV